MCLTAASLMALAPGIDLSVARNARPDGTDLFGYLYQLLARGFASVDENRLTVAVLFAACLWLCVKFLFRKADNTGVGEYLLCGFMAGMMLLSMAVRTQDTVSVLWANAFQLFKAFTSLVGLYFLFLMLFRSFHYGIGYIRNRNTPVLSCAERQVSFWTIFAMLFIAWLPHMIVRYPGVLMWDSYLQIKQFMGEIERWSNHPPFGTLLYGCIALLGEKMGNRNLVYFVFTLLQCAAYIAVLSYSLCVMRRQRTGKYVCLGIFLLYAISPCIVGWATVISKDTAYQIALLLMAVELLVFVNEREWFFKSCKHFVLLGIGILFMILNRHNGAPLAALVLAAMLGMLIRAKQHRAIVKLLACFAASFVLAFGAEAAISAALHIQDRYIQDVLSLPLQQTARVVKLHPEEITQEEKEIIDRVVDYENLAENYVDWYADAVKDTYRQTASASDRTAYWNVWAKQLLRWPTDYLDAALNMNGVLFDLNDNRPMYIGFSDMELHSDVYPYSFNDMTMYDREALVPLNSAQRAVTEWYMDFDRIPLLGLTASMSFNVCIMLFAIYGCCAEKQYGVLLVWLPAVFTFGMCLFAPVVYLRYALPLIGTVPLCLTAWIVRRPAASKEGDVA